LLPLHAQQPATTAQQPAAEVDQSVTRPKNNPIPDTYVNLMVLPKDITKKELIGVMKNFSMTFGVRCSYCHAVSDDLTAGRFETDDKETKRKARELVKAIQAISAARLSASTSVK
jgi:hypothetical protein